MKKLIYFATVIFTLPACGHNSGKANAFSTQLADVQEPQQKDKVALPSSIICSREDFKPTKVGDVILIQPLGRESGRSMTPVIQGNVVKFAVSDAETSCVDDMEQIGRLGVFDTPLKFKSGQNGEPEYFIESQGDSFSVGEGRASPRFCRESDNCEFVVKQTGKYVVEYIFRKRDTSQILLAGKMILSAKPTYAAVFGISKN